MGIRRRLLALARSAAFALGVLAVLFAIVFSAWRGLVNLPDVLPMHLIIILALAALATLVVLGFTAWRLVGNVKDVIGAVGDLNRKLAPGLAKLEQGAAQMNETAARLQTHNPAGSAKPRP